MPFGKTNQSVTASCSGTVRFSQLDKLISIYTDPAPDATLVSVPPVVTISAPGGSLTYTVEIEETTGPGNNPPDYYENLVTFYIRCTCSSGNSQRAATGLTCTIWTDYSGGFPPDGGHTFSGDTDYQTTFDITRGVLWLHKWRDWCLVPPTIANRCSPLHGGMKYTWGSDDYTNSQDGTIASDADTGLTMTPTWGANGGGTTDLGSVSVSLAACGQMNDLSGELLRVSGVTMNGDSLSYGGASASGSGLSWSGSGDVFTCSVTDYSSMSLSARSAAAIRNHPTRVEYDLECTNWMASMSADMVVADDDGIGTQVITTPYTEQAEYARQRVVVSSGVTDNSTSPWDDSMARVWSVAPPLDSDWATLNNENVDPPDLACVIEETCLDMTDPASYAWSGFRLRRKALSVQMPDDAGGVLPSSWISETDGVTVAQVGKVTYVTVAEGVENGTISRTLEEDWFTYYTTSAGITAYGLPDAYQFLLHQAGSDIWCWDQFGFNGFHYVSPETNVLTWALGYRSATVNDNHSTGSTRTDAFEVTSGNGTWSTQVAFPASASEAQVYADFGYPDKKLQHVDSISLSGLKGRSSGGGSYTFELHDLTLPLYNPTTGGLSGKMLLKIVHTRPAVTDPEDEDAIGGLPINYTGLTAICEGTPACRPADQIRTRSGEAGLDFVDLVRPPSGIIQDRMLDLASWFFKLSRLEGLEVETVSNPFSTASSGFACSTSHATYQAAFVDADSNDMLGGLTTGDCVEVIDQEITDSYTQIDVRPRVGRTYLASGTTDYLPCVVRKILHGNAHGVVEQGGIRGASGITCYLHDSGTGLVGSKDTDDWGWCGWTGLGGVKENNQLGVVVASTDSPSSWYSGHVNKCRIWIGPSAPGGCDRIGKAYHPASGHAIVLRSTGSQIKYRETKDNCQTWSAEASAFDGESPCAFYDEHGNAVCMYARSGGIRSRRLDDSWSEESLVVMGYSCPAAVYEPGEGVAYMLGRSGSNLYFMQANPSDSSPYALEVDTATLALLGTLSSGNAEIMLLGNGALQAVWFDAGTSTWHAKQSTNRGATWTTVSM